MQSDCEVKESNGVQSGCTFKKGCMSEKSLEDKMAEARHKWRGFFCNDDGSCSDTPDKVYEIGFSDGYELAQKELQEKLDAAIEVIKVLSTPIDKLVRDDIYETFDTIAMKAARDFLKARGE